MDAHLAEFIPEFRGAGAAVLVDDATAPSRAVVVAPARQMTAELMNRLITLSHGLPSVAISAERAKAFMLDEMSRPSTTAPSAPQAAPAVKYCVSVEAREGVTTGISAADRAITVSILGEETPNPRKLVKPGHVFPVEVRDGGVLMKTALPEGALDLVRAAGCGEAAFFSDLLSAEGALLDESAALSCAKEAGLPVFYLTKLIEERLNSELLIERVAEARLPTEAAGELRSIIYRSRIHGGEHLALVKGEIRSDQPILTRVQPEYTLGDVFGGRQPASRNQLIRSLEEIGRRGCGVLVYLRRPSAGELSQQVASHEQHPPGRASMMREYGIGAQILRDLGVKKVELLSASGRSLAGIQTFGIEIVAQHPIPTL